MRCMPRDRTPVQRDLMLPAAIEWVTSSFARRRRHLAVCFHVDRQKKIQHDGKLYMPTPQISLIQRRIETLKAELVAEKARLRRALIRHLFQIFYLETQVDINAQFPAHVYENAANEAETDGEADPTCSVCMQSFEGTYVRTLACGHVFHDTCIDEWVKRTENCPLCRREIVFEEHAPSHLLIDTLQALADVL